MRARPFVVYWSPVLLWMLVIFSASGDRLSFQHTSRFLEPFLHWVMPGLTDPQVHGIVVLVRKAAHVTEFGLLTVLVWRLVDYYRPAVTSGRSTSWTNSGATLLIVVLYAASDELHQRFVPSREASVRDVLIDASGAIFALLVLRLAARWRQPRFPRNARTPDQDVTANREQDPRRIG